MTSNSAGNFRFGVATDVLTSNGPGLAPTFQPPMGGGVSLSPYIVGTTGSSDYATIAAAIAQAVIDGASATNEKNIYVKPGVYTEDITISDGINVMGMMPYQSQDNYSSSAFPSNSFPSVRLTGTVTHSAGDGRICNIWIKPAADTNLFELDAPGGVLVVQGCRLSPTGTGVSVVFNYTDADAVVCSGTAVADISATGLLFSAISPGGTLYANSSYLTCDQDCVVAGTMAIVLSNSSMFAAIDGSGASSVSLNAYNSTHGAIFGSTFLIQLGVATSGQVLYSNCQLYPTSATPFDFPDPSQVVELIDCIGVCDYHKVSDIITTTYQASISDDFIACDSSGGAFTVTLFATPFRGMTVTVKDASGDAVTDTITIAGNIDTSAGGTTITQAFDALVFTWNSDLSTWMTN